MCFMCKFYFFLHCSNIAFPSNNIVPNFCILLSYIAGYLHVFVRTLMFIFTAEAFSGYRVKRQLDEEDEADIQKKICADAGATAGEWFRLQAGKDRCRDVVSCTDSVRHNFY